MRKIRSKYVGKVYDGWKVSKCMNADSGNDHKKFKLTKVVSDTKITITLRDNDLTKLANGTVSMSEILSKRTNCSITNLNSLLNA